jgi:hypothetical protein
VGGAPLIGIDMVCEFIRFWSLLQPWLPVIPVTSLPLVSSFGRGCGTMVAIDGEVS